jgi:hypothetical protein
MLQQQFPGLIDDDAAWLDNLDGLTDGLDLAEYLAERAIQPGCHAGRGARARPHAAGPRQAVRGRGGKLKAIILALVEAAGGKKVVRPGVTLSPRSTPPKVVATDEAQTPAQYMIEVVTQKPDKKAIRDALEIGAEVDGWMMTNGGRTIALLVR